MVRTGGQVGPVWRVGEPGDKVRLEPDDVGDPVEVGALAAIEVDPQELAIAEPFGTRLVEVDLAIAAVRVVQAAARACRRRPGSDGRQAQRRTARMATTTRARPAVAYWRTDIARSSRAPAPGSAIRRWPTREIGR